MWSKSFSPEINCKVNVLVLGSMPGVKSLQANEYYAHPRNAFWPLMEKLFGIALTAHYQDRIYQLNEAGIGLWDVYAECYRQGSLDTDIAGKTATFNNFPALLCAYPQIRAVFFNGKAAAKAFSQHIKPSLVSDSLHYVTLPSTSPAHAALSFEQKFQQWKQIKESVQHV